MSTTATNRMLTIIGLAEMLDVSPATIAAWRGRGWGPPSFRLGGGVRYRLSDVEAWLDAQREDRRGSGGDSPAT